MAGGSIKRHCFSEEDDVEPGYSGHNHFHHYQHGFISRTLGYGTFYNRRVRSHSIFSPRSGRFYDARFEDHQPHFLQACSLCKKRLGDNSDIFMYKLVAGPNSIFLHLSITWLVSLIQILDLFHLLPVLIMILKSKDLFSPSPHCLEIISCLRIEYQDLMWILLDLYVFCSDWGCQFNCRGDTPFCSEECRQEQIERDEAKEKNKNLSSSMKALRKKEQRNSVSPNKTQDYSFRAGTVAAA